MTSQEFASLVLALKDKFAFSVTSWGRTESHNRAVGGVATSPHLRWMAVDVVVDPGVDRGHFIETVRQLGATPIDEQTHIHIQGAVE
jgi:hypothetical protein